MNIDNVKNHYRFYVTSCNWLVNNRDHRGAANQEKEPYVEFEEQKKSMGDVA